MSTVQIDKQLFLDLIVYFSSLDDPTEKERSINERLSEKLERMAAREDYYNNKIKGENL